MKTKKRGTNTKTSDAKQKARARFLNRHIDQVCIIAEAIYVVLLQPSHFASVAAQISAVGHGLPFGKFVVQMCSLSNSFQIPFRGR